MRAAATARERCFKTGLERDEPSCRSLSLLWDSSRQPPAWPQSSPSPANSPAPTANTQAAASTASPSPSATVTIQPPSLIPPNILPAPDPLPKIPVTQELQQLNDFFKTTSLGKAADEHRLRLQVVALETRIRNDSDLYALKAEALREPTDLDRRHGLKRYYELYFKKLRALTTAPELKAYLDAQEAASKISLLQPRGPARNG